MVVNPSQIQDRVWLVYLVAGRGSGYCQRKVKILSSKLDPLQYYVSGRSKTLSSPVEILSNRELEVYRLLGRGLRKEEIAEEISQMEI